MGVCVAVGGVNTSHAWLQAGFMTQLTLGRKNTRLTHFTLSPMSCSYMYVYICMFVCILPVVDSKSAYTSIFSALSSFNFWIFVSLTLTYSLQTGWEATDHRELLWPQCTFKPVGPASENQRVVYSAWTLKRFAIPYDCKPHTHTCNVSSQVSFEDPTVICIIP